MRRVWRVMLVAGLCLLVGAMVNVAVTWCLAAGHQATWHIAGWRYRSFTGDWPVATPRDWPPPKAETMHGDWCATERIFLSEFRQGGALLLNTPAAQGVIVYSVGWPCSGMRAWCVWHETAPQTILFERHADCPFTQPDPATRGIRTWYFPLDPVWPGFAINAAFYGLLVWGIARLSFALYRWRRQRAGRCVRCGYELKGLAPGAVCPECGKAPSSSA